uniref:DUF1985 domain-containing protein n=1 Tax=Brassica oleracea TaxID=3712 RepID=A0A3P6AY96_BRAOL|nr:unnamed protein product [Brassica oleracea]
MGFDWASRLVHYMLGFQLDIKKKYELWSLVGPEPVRFSLLEFENLTGLNCEYIEDLERPHCVITKEFTSFFREMLGGWSRDDMAARAYLAIFTGYIKGRKYSTPTRVSLARLVMKLERFENYPWGRVAFKVLMNSVKGRDISGCYTINGFAQALQKPWKWTMDCWEVTGTWVNTKPAVVSPAKKKVVKEDSPRPRKKARKEASEEASEEAAAVASEEATAEASEESESVNGTNAGRKSLPEDKGPDVPADASSLKDKAPEPSLVLLDKNQSTVLDLQKEDARYMEKRDAALALCRAKSDRTRKLVASQQSPYTANNTAKVIILNKKLYPGYNPFAPIDKKKLKELADWLKTCP